MVFHGENVFFSSPKLSPVFATWVEEGGRLCDIATCTGKPYTDSYPGRYSLKYTKTISLARSFELPLIVLHLSPHAVTYFGRWSRPIP